jgi:hypothetical protein
MPMLSQKLKGIRLVELEGVTWLRVNVDPNNVETGPIISGAGSPCATEQVK